MEFERYYQQIIDNKMDMEFINFSLNSAMRDKGVNADDFKYLETVAKSLGFIWADNFELLG